MAATGSEAVTLEQLKRLKDSSSGGDGGDAIHVLELTASTPSFTFEKSGIVFTRLAEDFTIVAVDSEYGVGVLGIFQNDRYTSTVTVANVTGGDSTTKHCFFVKNQSGDVGKVTYDGSHITCTALEPIYYVCVSMWIAKA